MAIDQFYSIRYSCQRDFNLLDNYLVYNFENKLSRDELKLKNILQYLI